jgi:hypothetical protein
MKKVLMWVAITVIGIPVIVVMAFFVYLVVINTKVTFSGSVTAPGVSNSTSR